MNFHHLHKKRALAIAVSLLCVCLLSAYAAPVLAQELDIPSQEDIADAMLSSQAMAETFAPVVQQAKQRLFADWDASVEEWPASTGVLKIVNTFIIAFDEQQPQGTSEMEQKIWDTYYANMRYVVTFTVIGDYMGSPSGWMTTLPSARFGEYGITNEGRVERLHLHDIHSRTYADPIVPGMTVYDAGDLYNDVYQSPAAKQ